MYKVFYSDGTSRVFSLLARAKAFAKTVGSWYYIAYRGDIIYTQDDQIFEDLMGR